MKRCAAVLVASMALNAAALPADQQNDFAIGNDQIELRVAKKGGNFVAIFLKGDAEKLSPISSTIGHIPCVDTFGPPSDDERKAGASQHGEVRTLDWQLHSSEKTGAVSMLVCGARMPVAAQEFTRTLRMVDGEHVVYVSSVLENLTSIDRPITWAEHGTVGSPFLEAGTTFVDISSIKAMTRPATGGRGGPGGGRLKPGEPFVWPLAPARDGTPVDLRQTPSERGSNDITTQLMPANGFSYATALHTGKRLLFGYVFKAADYPWLANWESYPPSGPLNRGLEFAMTPYGMPRRDAVSMGKLFDAPTFRWLPAKGKVSTSYLMFFTRAPEGMRGVDRITSEPGSLVLHDAKGGRELRLKVSREW